MKAYGFILAIAITLIAGCTPAVQRMDPKGRMDLGGNWNDTDSRQVSEVMIADSLGAAWLIRHEERSGGRAPVVIVGSVRNMSHEHINLRTFVKDLERALINSGRVHFVASALERGEIRDERMDQARFSDPETAKAMGLEAGADYILQGEINTIFDRSGGTVLKFYQVNLELTDIRTNRKVWVGEHKIKKLVNQGRVGP